MPKKGENIYKRKDNRWEARYVKERDESGKTKYGYVYGKTYREAKNKLLDILSEPPQEVEPKRNRSKILFMNYCEEWLTINRSRIKESTYIKYMYITEKHIMPGLGKFNLHEIDSLAIEKFTRNLMENEGLAPKTVKDILTVLKGILKYADRKTPNTLGAVEICNPKDPRKEMRVLTKEEQQTLINYLLEDMDGFKFGILLALLTGLRIGEVCALRWENVSFTEKTIKIVSTMQRLRNLEKNDSVKTKVVISDPKSDTSMRVIPMTETVENLCKRFQSQDKEAFIISGTHRVVEPRSLQYKLKKYTEACGMEDVHFHVLRHTFATRCVEVGFEIKSLSEILGHSSPKITLERYVHSSLEMKRDNMNKLASLTFNI